MNAQTEPLDSDECPHGVPGGPCMQCYRAVYGTLDVVVARDLASAKADARPVDHAQATIGRLRVEVGLLASEVIRLRAEVLQMRDRAEKADVGWTDAEAALGQAKSEFRAEIRVQIEKWDEQVTFHGERADKAEAALAAALECARVRGEALKCARETVEIAYNFADVGGSLARTLAEDIATIDAALAIQPTDPALAEVVAAREEVERVARRLFGPYEKQEPIAALNNALLRLDSARRKLGGGA